MFLFPFSKKFSDARFMLDFSKSLYDDWQRRRKTAHNEWVVWLSW